ncbi:helix-hairpin-helix domain-containing protein [Hydrogenovibrio sp. 3SP14C1]|uniref:ComEA family DNA-binding protein n=1 Tax=Hydrogenovibrio sp. 3SP14C1 TaxID=3038774 RepID=UPI00241692D8|nr:helix-hairpin-helix domain-containing protein [Hydrogenovibrio sp. 3SP14C1]MDG4812232.1 helix-hairpin-helix domain-containing protein [Hydrogenovibrio sp. 3SP14C1]
MIKLVALMFGLFLSVSVLAAPVNVNNASAEEMAASLSGVGQVKAEAIVTYRKAHVDFKTVESLGQVKGIGAKTIAKNKKDILLSDPK